MTGFLTAQTGHSSTRSTKARRSAFRPHLEGLEDRCCPTCTITPGLETVTITGDNAANLVTVKQNDLANTLQVTCDGSTQTFSSSQVKNVVVDLRGGNDSFAYWLTGGTDFTQGKNITVATGGGKKELAEFYFNVNHDSGELASIKADLAITVNGSKGVDHVWAGLGRIWDHVNVSVNAYLGWGDDSGYVAVQGPVLNDAHVLVNLQGGPATRRGADFWTTDNDQLNYWSTWTGSAHKELIGPDTLVEVTLEGNFGSDSLGFTDLTEEMDGTLRARLLGGPGDDTAEAYSKLGVEGDGLLDALVAGGTGKDSLGLYVYDDSVSGDMAVVQALLDGGDGWDRYGCWGNVTVINAEQAFLLPIGGVIVRPPSP